MVYYEKYMLDDLKMIHNRDTGDALGVAEKLPAQLLHDIDVRSVAALARRVGPSNIVYWGAAPLTMSAELVRGLPGLKLPLEIISGQVFPAYVDKRTLLIIASYDADDGRALAMVQQAVGRCAATVVMAPPGPGVTMADEAASRGALIVEMPAGLRERQLPLAGLVTLLAVLRSAGLVDGPPSQLLAVSRWLASEVAAWLPTVPTVNNEAKTIALELVGKSVLLSSGPHMATAAGLWKSAINANAKQLAWCSQSPAQGPGLDESAAWTRQPVAKPYAVVDIRSSLEEAWVGQYFELNERLLSGLRPSPIVVRPAGSTRFEQLLYCICLGEFVSLYAALLAGTDPVPAPIVSAIYKEMS